MTPDPPGAFAAPPPVPPVDPVGRRPRWSVMIPTRHCAGTLRRTLESVLRQAPSEAEMQIEVVDDASESDDPAAVVAEIGAGRVGFHRHARNVGVVANFNTCLARARGHLVHLLHGDDWVLPGFYAAIAELADRHPDAGFLAVRSFFCDAEGIPEGVTGRIRAMEGGVSRDPAPFFRVTPVQCPGVVVRRGAYEAVGGFRPELTCLQDREMWCRVVASCGGVMLPEVLAAYRRSPSNHTSRTRARAEHLEDAKRCAESMAATYPGFPAAAARDDLVEWARSEAEHFRQTGDREAAAACGRFWTRHARVRHRIAAAAIAAEGAARRWSRRLLGRPDPVQ